MELSIDPVQKNLLRIYCQSINSAIEYKSIEFDPKTTAQEVILKVIELLHMNSQISEFVLCETIGRCMQLRDDGSIKKKIAKAGQSFLYIEQNRRVLQNTDYIGSVLTLWRPPYRFSRRIELWYANIKNQMSSSPIPDDEIDTIEKSVNSNGSLSSASEITEDKATQTDLLNHNHQSRNNRSKCPHLLTLKGDEKMLVIDLTGGIDFGGPGSGAKICLERLQNYENRIICKFSMKKTSEECYLIIIDDICASMEPLISINGIQVTSAQVLITGNIINIGETYSFFFKDGLSNSNDISNTGNYKTSNGVYSDQSYKACKSNSISSSGDTNINGKMTLKSLKQSKILPTKLTMITIECFDVAFGQIIHHYVRDEIALRCAIGLAIYLIRFCRESPRCCFIVDNMQDQMMKRFCSTFEEGFKKDNYLTSNLKLTALVFQVWMVYNTDNSIQSTEENRQWLSFFESFSLETFGYASKYICETAKKMSSCFFDENPYSNIDQSEADREEDNKYTMEKLLDFLTGVYGKINSINCSKTSEIFKGVLTSHLILCLTASTVSQLLSDMKDFTWNKGIFLSSQLDKFEKWLNSEGQFVIYESDGFLYDFSKLVSTRLEVLKTMDWRQLKQNYKRIPATILRQFLLSLASNDDFNPRPWQPPQNEMSDSNQDVTEVLSTYLRTQDQCTLFQPSIILQNECFPINEIIQSSDFLEICATMDAELIAMKVDFQWMTIPIPGSFKRLAKGKVEYHQYSINEDRSTNMTRQNSSSKKRLSIVKKLTKKKMETETDGPSPIKYPLTKYSTNSNLKLLSKSLVSLNQPDIEPTYDDKSIYSSVKKMQSNGGVIIKRPSYNPLPSSSTGSNFVPPRSSADSDFNRVVTNYKNYRIKSTKNSQNLSKSFENLSKLSPNQLFDINTSEYDRNVPSNENPPRLSLSGDTDRMRIESNTSDVFMDDAVGKIEVTITRSIDETYGITIVDGQSTSLKKDGIFVFKVTENSPVDRCNKISPGDEILAINNYLVKELNFHECLMLMKRSHTELTLLIYKTKLPIEFDIPKD